MPIDKMWAKENSVNLAISKLPVDWEYPVAVSEQKDAVLVRAMAEQALEDASIVDSLLDAGCSFDECAAAFSDGQVIN
jgi:hypothetical protein